MSLYEYISYLIISVWYSNIKVEIQGPGVSANYSYVKIISFQNPLHLSRKHL